MLHDSEQLLEQMQEAPPSPSAKRAHLSRYLRDNAYYTLKSMDLSTFTSVFPGEGCEGDLGFELETTVPEKSNHAQAGRRRHPSKNAVLLHQMNARLSVLKKQSEKKATGSHKPRTIGIFSKQKKAHQISSVDEEGTRRHVEEKGTKSVNDEMEIITLSVDSLDNVISSNTRYNNCTYI